MAALQMKFPGWRGKVLTLSYDDGTVHDIKMMEILDRYGLKAAFHLSAGLFFPEDGIREKYDGRMKRSEAKALYIGSGHEVACHALNHSPLAVLTEPEIIQEVMEDRKDLESEFGTIISGFAYPFGSVNSKAEAVLKSCGIQYARCSGRTGNFSFPPENWLRISSTCHHKAENLMELAKSFVEANPPTLRNMMFFMYGHSYEFAREDNWEILERFAEYVGGRADIWYATPGQIRAYTKAFEALERSADGKILHNPTNTTLYVTDMVLPGEEGRKISIEPGQTVFL